jgi:hypothetical protein
MQAKVVTKDEERRIAIKVAKLRTTYWGSGTATAEPIPADGIPNLVSEQRS